jgi:hypothetical protein
MAAASGGGEWRRTLADGLSRGLDPGQAAVPREPTFAAQYEMKKMAITTFMTLGI